MPTHLLYRTQIALKSAHGGELRSLETQIHDLREELVNVKATARAAEDEARTKTQKAMFERHTLLVYSQNLEAENKQVKQARHSFPSLCVNLRICLLVRAAFHS